MNENGMQEVTVTFKRETFDHVRSKLATPDFYRTVDAVQTMDSYYEMQYNESQKRQKEDAEIMEQEKEVEPSKQETLKEREEESIQEFEEDLQGEHKTSIEPEESEETDKIPEDVPKEVDSETE